MISDSVTIALIGSIFPTISIVVTAYFQYRVTKKNTEKLNDADIKLDQIHVLTNSTLTIANDRIKTLEDILNKK